MAQQTHGVIWRLEKAARKQTQLDAMEADTRATLASAGVTTPAGWGSNPQPAPTKN